MRRAPYRNADIVIVGGGIIGCAIAYYATKANLTVTLIESGKIGGQASSVAAGLIAPSGQIKEAGPFAALASASMQLFPALVDELKDTSGIDVEYHIDGSLRLALSETDVEKMQERLNAQQEAGFVVSWMTPDVARSCDRSITPHCLGAVFCPNEGQINAQLLTQAFANAAQKRGATFIQSTSSYCNVKRKQVLGIRTTHENINAANTVFATGAWVPNIDYLYGFSIPITPLKGQIASVTNLANKPRYIIFGNDLYVCSRPDGTITVGATEEEAGYDMRPNIGGMVDLFSRALQVVPELDKAQMKSMKAGLRPRTPDKLPLIGKLPDLEHVYIAAGHNSNGILMSAITGQMIISEILGNGGPLDSQPYQPSRFQPTSITT